MATLSHAMALLLAQYLPGNNSVVNSLIGLVLGDVTQRIIIPNANTCWNKLFMNNVILTISSKSEPIIYKKLQYYIVNKFLAYLQQCTIASEDGKINLQGELSYPINDMFENHKIQILVQKNEKNEKNTSETIIISIISKTASLDILKKYVQMICQYKSSSTFITVYRACMKTGKRMNDEHTCYWQECHVVLNKRICNNFLSEKNEQELYKDVEWFLNNEDYYNEKGIPYKRGYLLEGVPGTGKTGAIKAIANEYDLNVFTIDCNLIINISDILNLMAAIPPLTENKKYILALEDMDRCPLFSGNFAGFNVLTPQALLQELDGIIETHGRILFITVNDAKLLESVASNAFLRPGRIDKRIYFDYCDENQIKRMLSYFLGTDVIQQLNIDNKLAASQISPAAVVSVLQRFAQNPEKIIDLLEKNLFIENVINEQKNMTVAKKRKKELKYGTSQYIKNRLRTNNGKCRRLTSSINDLNKKLTKINKNNDLQKNKLHKIMEKERARKKRVHKITKK